jgi:hypothetical protein
MRASFTVAGVASSSPSTQVTDARRARAAKLLRRGPLGAELKRDWLADVIKAVRSR